MALFHKNTWGLQHSTHCQMLHSALVESALSTLTRTGRAGAEEIQICTKRGKKGGCGQGQVRNSGESPIPLCCNSETRETLHPSVCCLGTPPPHLGLTSNGRMMLHFSLQLPPSPQGQQPGSPTQKLRWAPLHLCDICCSRHLTAPARGSRVLGCRGASESGSWWTRDPTLLG